MNFRNEYKHQINLGDVYSLRQRLSMVKSIIELHGGEITVKSSVDGGTKFRIIL